MEQTANLRLTPLNATHRALGARMVGFCGWEMPVQYAGVIAEHEAVRTAAGLFDVSHMGEVEIRGAGALQAIQRLTCNDVSVLQDGQAQYSALLNEAGGVIDDLIVYRLDSHRFLTIVNASNASADFAWMLKQVGSEAEVVDRSEEYGLLALQGPRAAEVLATLTDAPLDSLASFSFYTAKVNGTSTLVARTGYTGEDGFELLVPAGETAAIWKAILDSGRNAGIHPIGLGARDTLRLEAGLLLHGNDMTPETSALEAGLGFVIKWDAGEFIGKAALQEQKGNGLERRQRGLEMVDRGIARHGYPVVVDGEVCGEVTSGSFAPSLKKNIARAYLPVGSGKPGTEVEIEVRGKRLRARVVKTPFYRRCSR